MNLIRSNKRMDCHPYGCTGQYLASLHSLALIPTLVFSIWEQGEASETGTGHASQNGLIQMILWTLLFLCTKHWYWPRFSEVTWSFEGDHPSK
jgi:hypothetical protein